MGDCEAGTPVSVESTLKYHSGQIGRLTSDRDPVQGQRQVGSLTGAVASQNVTEAPKVSLSLVGNQASSAKAQGSLTARPQVEQVRKQGLVTRPWHVEARSING